MDRREKCQLGWGITLAVLAGVCVAGVVLFDHYFPIVFNDTIVSMIAMNGTASAAYPTWNTTDWAGGPPVYVAFHFFHISNYKDVLSGAKPIANETGPFVYHKNMFDVTFLDNNTKGEWPLSLIYSSVELRRLFEFLNKEYIPDVQSSRASAIISAAQSTIVNYFVDSRGMSPDGAAKAFYDLWAQGTTDPTLPSSALWRAMQVPLATNSSLSVSDTTAATLFLASTPYSLVDTTQPFDSSAVKLWALALTTPAKARFLADKFGLSVDQVTQVSKWISSSLFTDFLSTTITADLNISSISTIPCLQWGSGAVTSESVAALYGSDRFAAAPEFFFFAQAFHQSNPGYLTLEQCQDLTEGPNNILWPQQFADFLGDLVVAAEEGNFSLPHRLWLLNANTSLELLTYMYYMRVNFAVASIQRLIDQGNTGLFVSRTIDEWLFSATDSLMAEFLPDPPSIAFQTNMTSLDQARQIRFPSVVYTGVGDVKKIQKTIEWRGYSSIDWAYPNYSLPVYGSTEMESNLAIFDDDFVRHWPLNFMGEVEVAGLSAYRYSPSNATLLPNKALAMDIQGFANMQQLYNGTPIYFSNPHFFTAPERWVTQVIGVVQNASTDVSYFDVEPNSGAVIQMWKGLQINLYLPNGTLWFLGSPFGNSEVTLDVMYPLSIGYQTTVITADLAGQLSTNLYGMIKLRWGLFYSLIGLSVISFVASLTLFVGFRRRTGIHAYSEIN